VIAIIADFFFIPVMSAWIDAISNISGVDQQAVEFNKHILTVGVFTLLIFLVGGFIWLVVRMLKKEEFEYLR
jgi:flagellar biogenesis protein FliO